MDWYLGVLRRYADFSGRARRKEYWMFVLVNALVAIALTVLSALTQIKLFSFVYLLYLLATILPSLAVSVRRLHDTDRSGLWILLGMVPLVGVVLLVFLIADGTPGPNRFGPSPKVATSSPNG